MNDGYGFGAEGDWKTAAMLRTMKIMSAGLPGGNSFMEDYTYHFDPAGMRVLGAAIATGNTEAHEVAPLLRRERQSRGPERAAGDSPAWRTHRYIFGWP